MGDARMVRGQLELSCPITGLALPRYQGRAEASFLGEHAAFGLDVTMFTDRISHDPIGPSEVDFTSEIISRRRPFEFHVAYERDVPVNRGGFTETSSTSWLSGSSTYGAGLLWSPSAAN
jgi:hypothetical protein